MNDGFLLVMSYFPTTGRRVFFVKAQRFADFGSEEAVAAPLAGGGEGTVGSVPGVACQREFSAVSGKDGSGPYVFSGLRRFFRQQMDAVPLLVYWSFSMMARSKPPNCCPILWKWPPYPPSPLQKIFCFGVRRANSAHRVLLRSNKRLEKCCDGRTCTWRSTAILTSVNQSSLWSRIVSKPRCLKYVPTPRGQMISRIFGRRAMRLG